MSRQLAAAEVDELLAGDHIAHLATIDEDGYPHVMPLWFVYEDDTFRLASNTGRPHLHRIRANPKVGLVIDTEQPERPDGERPNRQVRIVGDASLAVDADAEWTVRIWAKYSARDLDQAEVERRLHGRHRTVISVRPRHVTAIASV